MEKLLSALPSDSSALMRDLLVQEHIPIHRLRVELSEHLARMTEHSSRYEFIDLETAMLLNAVCHKLLDRLTDATPEDHRRMVQAAVRYFILDDDAESDLDSPIGFDDDALVVKAVAGAVGAQDLVRGLP